MSWRRSWRRCYSKALWGWALLQACKPVVSAGNEGADTFTAPAFLTQENAVAAWERWRREEAAAIRPHVYRMEVRVRYPYGYETYRGTAWRWSLDGYLVTCRHLFPERGSSEIEVWDWTGACFSARLACRDSVTDVAFLRIDQSFDAVPLHRTAPSPPVGTTVISYGAPWGLLGTLAEGYISGENRYLSTPFAVHPFLQLSLLAQPGSSGSPVLDREGYVLGMISDIAGASGSYEGLTFAVPVQVIEQAWGRCRSFAFSHEPKAADPSRR